MKEPIIKAQIKIPEGSKLVGRTNKEIKNEFGIVIDHKHNPHPSKETCVDCSNDEYRLESDKFIHFSGARQDILRFTEELIKSK